MTGDDYLINLYGIRRANLKAQYPAHGGIVQTAAKIGVVQSRLSQLMSQPFGEKVARNIEFKLGMPFGSLDVPSPKAKGQKEE